MPDVLDELAALDEDEAVDVLDSLSEQEIVALAYDWVGTFARPNQLPPGHPSHSCSGCDKGRGDDGSWSHWLISAGRGGGKTRAGAEQIKTWEREGYRMFYFVAETKGDMRDVMVEGESGILSVYPPSERPVYQTSTRSVVWSSGAKALLFSGDVPDQLRGPQAEKAWVDEIAKYKYPVEAWDNLEMGLRKGDNPQSIITTTPRPTKIIKDLYADPDVHISSWSTYENKANLAKKFIRRLLRKYEGTRKGRQELWAELLEAIEGGIVDLEKHIDAHRFKIVHDDEGKAIMPEVARVVVAVDPAVTHTKRSDETGIITVGKGVDDDYYVFSDRSCKMSVSGWARRAADAYHDKTWTDIGADLVVGEVNNGGDLVEANIRTVDKTVNFKAVRASKGKHVRFEPIGSLYEQGRIHHVGTFTELEDQICGFSAAGYEGDGSPDRADALVWAITELEEVGEAFLV